MITMVNTTNRLPEGCVEIGGEVWLTMEVARLRIRSPLTKKPISKSLLARYCREKRIPRAQQFGGSDSWMIPESDLQEFLKKPRPVGRPPKTD